MSKDVFNALLCVLKLLSKVKQNQHELKSFVLFIKFYIENRKSFILTFCFKDKDLYGNQTKTKLNYLLFV